MNMISENKYLIFFIGWYIYNYGPPRILIYYILKAYYFSQNVFNNLNKVIHPDYWKEEQQNTVVQTDNIQQKTEENNCSCNTENKLVVLFTTRKING